MFLVILISLILNSACSGPSSSSQSPDHADSTEKNDHQDMETLSRQKLFQLVQEGIISEDVGACLGDYKGELPFDENSLQESLEMTLSGDDIRYTDSNTSEEAELLLLKVSADTIDDIDLHLMNPNGWYCLDIQAIEADDVRVVIHCQAKLLGSGVNIAEADDVSIKEFCPSTQMPEADDSSNEGGESEGAEESPEAMEENLEAGDE